MKKYKKTVVSKRDIERGFLHKAVWLWISSTSCAHITIVEALKNAKFSVRTGIGRVSRSGRAAGLKDAKRLGDKLLQEVITEETSRIQLAQADIDIDSSTLLELKRELKL
jgi:hypothetical protein